MRGGFPLVVYLFHTSKYQLSFTWQIDILIPKCVFKKSKYWKVKQIKSFGSISNKARQNWLLSGCYLLWLIIQQQRYQPNGSNTNVDIKCSAHDTLKYDFDFSVRGYLILLHSNIITLKICNKILRIIYLKRNICRVLVNI